MPSFHVDNTLYVSGSPKELERFFLEKWETIYYERGGISVSILEYTKENEIVVFFDSWNSVSDWVIEAASLFPKLHFFMEWTWFEANDGIWETIICEGQDVKYYYTTPEMEESD